MGNRYSSSEHAAPLISLAEARKHLSNEEFVRLQNAFGRINKSHLSLDDFSRHVLGGANVPENARHALFTFFSSGSDSITFEGLLCALVGVCRSEDVQARFIEEHAQFASWGLRPPLLTIPVNDSYINFYEVMSYVTHLSVAEVMELERVFLKLSQGAVMLLPSHWKSAAGGCFPESFVDRLFRVLDESRDGEVDFREMVCGVSAMCRGPTPSRHAFVAKLWDEDCDGMLSAAELQAMYEELNVPASARTVELSARDGTAAALVDYAQWAIQHSAIVAPIYDMAQEIGHICFGLRPESPAVELTIVRGFESRLHEHPPSCAEFNIVSAVWRRDLEKFLERAAAHQPASQSDNSSSGSKGEKVEQMAPIDNSPLTANVEAFPGCSKLPCISPESSCLRRDLSPKDWVAVPRCLWAALVRWHGVARPTDEVVRRRLPTRCGEQAGGEEAKYPGCEQDGSCDLEMHPLHVRLERRKPPQNGILSGVMGGGGGREGGGGGAGSSTPPVEGRDTYAWAYAQISRVGRVSDLLSFCSRDLRVAESDLRLWLLTAPLTAAVNGGASASSSPSASPSGAPALIDDPSQRLCDITGGGDAEPVKMLLEQRDRSTGVWPEEARFAQTGASIAQSSVRGPAVGLINYGNFCYRNAAVQCLARVEPLSRYLLESEPQLRERAAKKTNRRATSAALHYVQLLREMRTSGKKNISPVQFNDAIRETRAFDGALQHDCEEFVSFLLSQLHYAMREEGTGRRRTGEEKRKESSDEEDDDEGEDGEKAEMAWREHLESEASLITALFTGQLRSTLVCNDCGKRSATFDPFTALPVPIGFENVELFEIIVVRRDASIPLRYGARLARDASMGALRLWVADKIHTPKERLRLLRLIGHGRQRLSQLSDDEPIARRPAASGQLYVIETDGEGAEGKAGGGGEGGQADKTGGAGNAKATIDPVPAVHRRMQLNHEPYLLGAASGCSVSLFGVPIIVQPRIWAGAALMGRAYYDDVWRQLQRFLSTPPPSFASRALDPCEDASAGFPFSLSIVDESLEWCALCPPLRFCRGCTLRTDLHDPLKDLRQGAVLAIDWLPIALYLKYNHSQSLACADDASLALAREQHVKPSSLDTCLRRFASPETLDDPFNCKRCKRKTKRDKHMDVWRLPQYLIVQLKRFEYVREEGRMAKCKRVIDFPLSDFDASPYIRGPHENESRPDSLVYDCIAIANHYGELEAGHFVAYARGRRGWLLLNDCTVREVEEAEVDKKGAYLLFYERRGQVPEEKPDVDYV